MTEISAAAERSNVKPVLSGLEEAFLLYRKGNFDAALEKYERILKENPRSPDAYAGEVRTYLKMKKVDQAAVVADKGLAVSNAPRIRTARAEVWFRQVDEFAAVTASHILRALEISDGIAGRADRPASAAIHEERFFVCCRHSNSKAVGDEL